MAFRAPMCARIFPRTGWVVPRGVEFQHECGWRCRRESHTLTVTATDTAGLIGTATTTFTGPSAPKVVPRYADGGQLFTGAATITGDLRALFGSLIDLLAVGKCGLI